MDDIYLSPAHSDGEPVSKKLTESSAIADILAKKPLDDNDVGRRALLGIGTRNVTDAYIDNETWRSNMTQTVNMLNGYAPNFPSQGHITSYSNNQQFLGRDEESTVAVSPAPGKSGKGRGLSKNLKKTAVAKSKSFPDQSAASPTPSTIVNRKKTEKQSALDTIKKMDSAIAAQNLELEDLSISDRDINEFGNSKMTHNDKSGNSTMAIRNDQKYADNRSEADRELSVQNSFAGDGTPVTNNYGRKRTKKRKSVKKTVVEGKPEDKGQDDVF